MSDDIFGERSDRTEKVVATLRESLTKQLGDPSVIGAATCVYATGSCGRGEMGRGSDLDAFVIHVDDENGQQPPNEDRITTAIRTANGAANLPALDNDGRYLKPVKVSEIVDLLGAPDDDKQDVLTKRMLLLLESRPLVGPEAYDKAIRQIIDVYWPNEELHPDDYLPFVLVNDIVRYWRIVLLNHESKLRKKEREIDSDPSIAPADKQGVLLAQRRYRSYKLRLPRCLSCFSALTYLLALTPNEPSHVTKGQVRTMIGLTPVQRLRQLPTLVGEDLETVNAMLELYREYLERTDVDKPVLVKRLCEDVELQRTVSSEGSRFTKLMFQLVQQLGGGRPLHRHMLV